jgi:hypothetical protein
MSRFITYTNTLALFGLNVMLHYEQLKSTKHWDNCLSHCMSEDAQQWKENEKTDLDDSTNVDKQWNDWTGFKTRFLKNWEELDSPGNAFSELLKLNKWKFTTGKKRLSIIKYTERFKELIRKAGITDGNAIYQYSLGLTTDEYRSIALTKSYHLTRMV